MKFLYLPPFDFAQGKKFNEIPKTAGVYAFLGSSKPLKSNFNILYIGKATNLRNRVKNHFQKSSYRDNLFMDQVSRIGIIKTQSEIDALLLESQLIKKHQPKYNVMWKDDKRYFYVAITKEKLPIVFLTHQIQNTKYKIQDATYIGPFVEGKAIKEVLRILRRAFPYYVKKHGAKLCSWCHLNLCPGPVPNVEQYKKNIKNLILVLQGKRKSVLQKIKKEMEQAAKEQRFEQAAKLRDQFLALEQIIAHGNDAENALERIFRSKQKITRIEAYDISNMQGKESTGSMVTFINGEPAKNWYRKFKIRMTGSPNDFAMMEELISRRLNHPEWPYPDLMIIDGGKGQLTSALAALRKFEIRNPKSETNSKIQDTKYKIQVAALAKRNNELFLSGKSKPILLKNLPQSVENLILHIRDEAHRFAIAYHRKLRQNVFLPKILDKNQE